MTGQVAGLKGFSVGTVAGKVLGAALLLITLFPFVDFPVMGPWLLVMGVGYLALLFFVPHVWLLVLPVATVALDLTTYTGRFIYNELDLLFLVTIAFALLSSRYAVDVYDRKGALLLTVAYIAVVLLGYHAWQVFLSPPGALFSNPYYLPEYGYKVVKGMLWALLLTPLWLDLYKSDPQRITRWLLVGQCTAALVLGVVILWERGSLGVLLSGSAWYHVVNSLLDLSSPYRTTGIFSDMHTGGEVIDGVLLLLLPMSLLGLLQNDSRLIKLYALVAFCALAYCATVGITRATYVSFFLAGGAFFTLFAFSRWRAGVNQGHIPYLLLVGTFSAGMCAAYLSFSMAGSFALAACGGLAANALLGALLYGRNRQLALILWLVGGGVLFLLSVKAHFASRWVDHSVTTAMIITSVQLVFYILAVTLFLRFSPQSVFNRLLVLVLLVLLPSAFAVALGGYKFNERMETVVQDLDARKTHWRKVAASSEGTLKTLFLGNGVGAFPVNYVYHFPEAVTAVGSFVVAEEGGNQFLRLGAGEDLAFGQRVPIVAASEYTLQFTARAAGRARLAFFVCERNLIFATNFRSNCKASSIRLNDTGGLFAPFQLTLDSTTVGRRPAFFRWPTMIYMKNFSRNTEVDVDDVALSQEMSENLLANGSFSDGLDNWFFYNDFFHLPWHVKNIYVQSWYDNGALGLGLFMALCALAMLLPLYQPQIPLLYVAFATGIVAILIFGLFGSPLDSARVSWMFYFYLFASLLRPGRLFFTGKQVPDSNL